MNDILKGIKNIVFDFGCVIVDLDKHKCIDALNNIGAQRISNYVDECRQTDMFLALELGTLDVEGFCREVRSRARNVPVRIAKLPRHGENCLQAYHWSGFTALKICMSAITYIFSAIAILYIGENQWNASFP